MKRTITFAFICLLAALALLLSLSVRQAGRAEAQSEAQSFDVCIEDDGARGTALKVNSTTGDYLFCVGEKSFKGRGAVVKSAGLVVLQHIAADRKLSARIDTNAKHGSASFESPAGKSLGTIKDNDTADSKCQCR